MTKARAPALRHAHEADRLLRLASEALARADWSAAQSASAQRLTLLPDDPAALFLLGVALAEQGQMRPAIEALARTAQLEPQHAEARAQLARCLSAVHRLPEAAAAAQSALALAPRRAHTLDTIGVVFSRAQMHVQAAAAFRAAVAREPHNAGFRFNLASSLKFIGEIEAAEASYEACVRLDPHFWRAHSALSELRRQTPEHNHLARLRALLPQAQGQPDALLHLHHALAKESEDLGDYAQAFAHLTAGKAAKRQTLRYGFEEDAALFEALIQAFPAVQPVAQGFATREPIFVIGMPRTGTTLVERILSSHPQVSSAGELQNFGLALKRLSGTTGRKLLDVATIEAGLRVDPRRLGERYLASTRPATGHKPHFVDKMPLNFFYAGFIARALPQARIVCLRRHPLDTCLSNFRQLFAVGYSYYNYAYDLLDTGRYYLAFDRLMAHWRQALPGRVLEVHYEELIDNQKAETRRLLAFCGLDWDEACLHFERNAAPVATASAVQVRSPLYSGARGRWRHYRNELSGLVALLHRSGTDPEELDAPSNEQKKTR